MPVILDSNLLVALVSGDPRGSLVSQAILDWVNQGIELHAPELARYEFANALTRLIVAKTFPSDLVEEAWNDILILPITYHPLRNGARVVEVIAYPEPAECLRFGLFGVGRDLECGTSYFGRAIVSQRHGPGLQCSPVAMSMSRH
jgi:hypothetical protein